jgi:hypothetical protein
MFTAAVFQDWVQLPSGLFVSNGRMQKDGKMLSLYGALTMDTAAFNREAAKYDVRMDESDAPIDRLVKYSVFLARRDNDSSAIPTNREYVDILLDTAAAKAKSAKPLASFYGTLTDRTWDVVRDVLEFQENLPKGKYKATVLRFNEDGELEPVDDIVVPGNGWTRALGARHGYPIESSEDTCVVENLDNPNLSGRNVKGYWYVGSDPVGQQRLTLRHPCLGDKWLLRAIASRGRDCSDEGVGVIRLRRALGQAPRAQP